MTRGILVLNAGSSSIKFALYPVAPAPDEDAAACRGEIEGIGHALHLSVRDRAPRSGGSTNPSSTRNPIVVAMLRPLRMAHMQAARASAGRTAGCRSRRFRPTKSL